MRVLDRRKAESDSEVVADCGNVTTATMCTPLFPAMGGSPWIEVSTELGYLLMLSVAEAQAIAEAVANGGS